MPMHDWTRVEEGVYHHFLQCWTLEIKLVLNDGSLPENIYTLLEQAAVHGHPIGTMAPILQFDPRDDDATVYAMRKNVVTVRRMPGDEAVAVVEVASPGDRNGRWGRLPCHLYIDPLPPTASKPTTRCVVSTDNETRAYIQPLAVGEPLPDMPLFWLPDGCATIPLEATYTRAFAAVPARWREVIEEG